MKSDTTWREVHVRDLVGAGALAITDGYRVRNEELGVAGIPFVRGGDIGDGWINTTTTDHVRPEFIERVRVKLTCPGDVAFIIKGTVGRAGRLRANQPPVVLAPQVACWRVLDPGVLDSGFVFQLVRSRVFQAELDAVKTHGSMVADYVSITQQQDFRLPIPPLPEQRAIAHILGTLDDKIELNRRMNKTLEDMAQAIFKSWFIDFDGYTDFVESELGPIPRGWRVYRLRDCGSWVSGGTPSKSNPTYWGGDIPWMSAKSMMSFVIRDSDTKVTAAGVAHGAALVPKDTVLFVVRGMSLASEFRIGITVRDVAFNQDLKAIVPGPLVEPVLTAWFLKLAAGRMLDLAAEASHGTKRLQTSVLESLSLALPDDHAQAVMAAPLRAFIDRMSVLQEESAALAALRDALLPKLVSGELRLPEAEKIVETSA